MRPACATASATARDTLAGSRTSSAIACALPPVARELGGERRERVGAARGEHHFGAVLRQQLREVAAEPARRAGHERDAAGQQIGA